MEKYAVCCKGIITPEFYGLGATRESLLLSAITYDVCLRAITTRTTKMAFMLGAVLRSVLDKKYIYIFAP